MALITVVSFIVVVFVNTYIPHSYDVIEQQKPINIEKRLDVLYENMISCQNEENPRLIAECEHLRILTILIVLENNESNNLEPK